MAHLILEKDAIITNFQLINQITGCSRTDFGPQLNHFNKQDFTLIAFDPRGYGQSIPPYRDWPLEFIQRDAEDAIELVQVSNVYLI